MVRPAAPFRKLKGFEAGPVIHTPLYPDVAFCEVVSSCAAIGRAATIASRKSKTELRSAEKRMGKVLEARRAFSTLESFGSGELTACDDGLRLHASHS